MLKSYIIYHIVAEGSVMDGEGPDQTVQTRRVISAFTVSICAHFLSMIDAFTVSSIC